MPDSPSADAARWSPDRRDVCGLIAGLPLLTGAGGSATARTVRLRARTTALVLVDLQKGFVGLPIQPRPGVEVLRACLGLLQRFRAAGALVIAVRVGFSPGYPDALTQPVDLPVALHVADLTPDFWSYADGVAEHSDLLVTKRQWGAFHGTELDLQLRRRGVTDIVLGGLATNFGVESTGRQAQEHGYGVVLAEDACGTTATAELHEMAVRHVFPKFSRVRLADEIVLARV